MDETGLVSTYILVANLRKPLYCPRPVYGSTAAAAAAIGIQANAGTAAAADSRQQLHHLEAAGVVIRRGGKRQLGGGSRCPPALPITSSTTTSFSLLDLMDEIERGGDAATRGHGEPVQEAGEGRGDVKGGGWERRGRE